MNLPTNAERAERVRPFVEAYSRTYNGGELYLGDLIADILHHAVIVGEDPNAVIDDAFLHFNEERREGGYNPERDDFEHYIDTPPDYEGDKYA